MNGRERTGSIATTWTVVGLALVVACGGTQKQVRGATFHLDDNEALLAAQFESQEPKGAGSEDDAVQRCEYWKKRVEQVPEIRPHHTLAYEPDEPLPLHSWADAKREEACSSPAYQAWLERKRATDAAEQAARDSEKVRVGDLERRASEVSRAFDELYGFQDDSCRRANDEFQMNACRRAMDLLRSAHQHEQRKEFDAADADVRHAQEALDRVRGFNDQRGAQMTAFDAEREAAGRETDPGKAIPLFAKLCNQGDDISCHVDGGCEQSREVATFGHRINSNQNVRAVTSATVMQTFEVCKTYCAQGLPGACATAATYLSLGNHAGEATAARARACQLGLRDLCAPGTPAPTGAGHCPTGRVGFQDCIHACVGNDGCCVVGCP